MALDQINPTSESNDYYSIESFTSEIMNSAGQIFEIDRFLSNLMSNALNIFQLETLVESRTNLSNSFSLSSLYDEIFQTDFSSTMAFSKSNINNNAFVSLISQVVDFFDRQILISRGINRKKSLSLIGSYFINSPSLIINNDNFLSHSSELEYKLINNSYLKSINEFSLHQNFGSNSSSFHGLIKELIIDEIGIGHLYVELTKTDNFLNECDILKLNNKIKLYTNNHIDILSANIKSYNFDINKHQLYLCLDDFKLSNRMKLNELLMMNFFKHIDQNESFSYESTLKDKGTEIKDSFIEKKTTYCQINEQEILNEFIQNEINNYQWPLNEYIGIRGERAWRALKLAADISNFNCDFMFNYHKDLDWFSANDNYGSFSQRTYLIIRNFNRHIEQQKQSIS